MSGSVDIERLDRAVARLESVASTLGCEFPPAEPLQLEQLDRVEAAIAPLRLPSDIAHFYRTWSITKAGTLFLPHLCDLGFALDSWDEHRATEWPSAVLFPIAYMSHWMHFVELDHPDSPGPWIYDGAYAGGLFTLAHSCLAAWLEWIADEVEAGRVEEVWEGRWQLTREQTDDDERTERLRADDVPDDAIPPFDDSDRRQWPLRWNLADGFDPADYELRGPTHTLASFVEALRAGPASATIHVGLIRQMGHSAELADETGCLAVTLERQDSPFGTGRIWEVEISGDHQPDLQLLPYPEPEEPPQFDISRQDDPDYLAEYAAGAARRMAVRSDPVATVT
ncbi:MAG: hypothetical protein HKN41_06830, partial [Ilumatobacter sp.]|nr:hypothetical protein [Ilumatobacter sp.]